MSGDAVWFQNPKLKQNLICRFKSLPKILFNLSVLFFLVPQFAVSNSNQTFLTETHLNGNSGQLRQIAPPANAVTFTHSKDLGPADISHILKPDGGAVRKKVPVLPHGMSRDEFDRNGDLSKVEWLTDLMVQDRVGIDLSAFPRFVFGIKSPEPLVRLRFRDSGSKWIECYLTDVSSSETSYYSIPIGFLKNSLDYAKIALIQFTIDGAYESDKDFQLVLAGNR